MARQMNSQARGPRGMHGPGAGGSGEKAKDLGGTWKKIFLYTGPWKVALVIALVCAAIGAVCTLVGPSRLSDMTNCITEAITPDTDELQKVTETVSDNVSSNASDVTAAVMENVANPLNYGTSVTVNGVEISYDDQLAVAKALGVDTDSIEKAGRQIRQAEENGADPQALARQLAGAQSGSPSQSSASMPDMTAMDEGDVKKLLASMPQSFTDALYTDVTVDGVTISGADQRSMVDTLSGIDMHDTEAAMAKLDELPDSVKGIVKPAVDMHRVRSIALFLAALYALSWLLQAVQGWIMATVTQRVSQKMRRDISHKINRLPMSYYNHTSTGDVLSRVTNDVDLVGQSMNQSLSTLASAMVLFLGSLIMMLVTDVRMTLAAVAASIIGFALMMAIMMHSQKYFTRQQRDLGRVDGFIEEDFTGHIVVKAYNGEDGAQKTFDEMNESLRRSAFRAQALSGLMQPIMAFIGNLGYVAVCVTGAALVLNDSISFGTIVAFMMYVRYFTMPLSQMAQAVQSMQSAAAAGERVFEFLEAQEMDDESGKTAHLGKAKGYVEFNHVKFGYDPDRPIIHDFSASAQPGQKIAIVGPTGAGKTTLVNLLMRFYELDGGSITIDGVPTTDLTRENVHDEFCMVLQDTWLFEGTIRENLVYNTPAVTEEQLEAACEAVGLDHFVHMQSQGYDTMLNDQLSMSQGQRQQLTIARAMIADRPMLILDEATSSVDTRTEQQIQRAMDKLMEGRTSFVIAHRLSTIKNADLILVLKGGDIVESGTHDELLAKGGAYADLYNSQFDEPEEPQEQTV